MGNKKTKTKEEMKGKNLRDVFCVVKCKSRDLRNGDSQIVFPRFSKVGDVMEFRVIDGDLISPVVFRGIHAGIKEYDDFGEEID